MTSRNTRRALACALLLAGITAHADQAALTPTIKSEVIDRTATALTTTYIEVEGGKAIADFLRRQLADGAYDAMTNPAQFADAVTTDMRRRNGDLHLGLQFTPPTAATPGAAPPPAVPNFGLSHVEILDGNVGYLEVRAFAAGPGYQAAVDAALRILEPTHAIIIDLRRNGGGSSAMSHYLFSHFFDATPRPTIRIMRRESAPIVSMSVAEVGGPRRPDVPLYVLTSSGTASAAEEFPFVLRNHKRATLVGSRTAGAGRMVRGVPVGHGFTARISITRVLDPASGIEWESEGLEPHVPTHPREALLAAHEAALVVVNSTAPSRARELLIEVLRAERTPMPISPQDLTKWAGTYGTRVISVFDGALWIELRAGALPQRLVPLGPGRFGVGSSRYVFAATSGRTTLTIEQPNGTSLSLPRS
jgi:hypothetical protein